MASRYGDRSPCRRGWGRILVVLALCLGAPLLAAPAAADPDDVENVIEVAAPLDVVWRVLTDFKAWPRFVPGLKRVAVVGGADSRVLLRHETESAGFSIDFTALTVVEEDAHRVESVLDPSAVNDLAAMRASWQITPLDSQRVQVRLRSAVDSGRPVPRFLERRVLRDSVAETLKRFGSEVERRLAEPGAPGAGSRGA